MSQNWENWERFYFSNVETRPLMFKYSGEF